MDVGEGGFKVPCFVNVFEDGGFEGTKKWKLLWHRVQLITAARGGAKML